MPLKLSFIILFLSIFTIDVCQAQDTILKTVHLKHNKTGRLKKLKSGNIYEFVLSKESKIKGTIVSATDSVIIIHTYEKYGNGYNVTSNVSDLQKISSYLIKGEGVQEAFAVALILPALIIIASP